MSEGYQIFSALEVLSQKIRTRFGQEQLAIVFGCELTDWQPFPKVCLDGAVRVNLESIQEG